MTTVRPIVFISFALFIAAAASSGAQEQPEGERVFRTRCGSCHSVEPAQNRVGPHLAGTFGRKAGSVEGARYSDALRASGLTWDEGTLDRYLANPRQAVPGTIMTVGLPDVGQRSAIIAYLRGLKAPE